MKHYSQISFVICASILINLSFLTLIVCSILAVSGVKTVYPSPLHSPQKVLIHDTAAIVAELASRNEKAAKIRQLLQVYNYPR
jgi:hypothetical protein